MTNSRRRIAPLLGVVLIALFATVALADDASSKSIASAKILLKNKDYDGAKQLLAPVVEKDENNAEAIYLLACSDEGLGNIKEALDEYYKSLELLKADPNADPALKKQAQSAANRLDEGRKLVLAHAKQMEQEAAKFKEKNPLAYETVMAAVQMMTGDDATLAASKRMQSKQHPRDAVEFKGHWYKFFDTPMTWYLAQKKCEGMGGRLTVVASDDLRGFVAKMVKSDRDGYVWIGGNRDTPTGRWEWIDGTIAIPIWDVGQPNNGRDEMFLAIRRTTGLIHDCNLADRCTIICEWDK